MKKIISILLITCVCQYCFSQDVTFSQQYNLNSYLNPAYTGGIPGILVTLGNRNQWTKIPGAFNSKIMTISGQFAKFYGTTHGVSLSGFDNTDGFNILNTSQFSSGYAFHSMTNRFHFHLGVDFSYVTRSLDWSRLVFSDQLDAALGQIGFSVINPPLNNNYTTIRSSFGGIIGWEREKKDGKSEYQASIGYSLKNLVAYRKAFYDEELRSSKRHTLHFELFRPLTSLAGKVSSGHLTLNPQVVFNFQNRLREFNVVGFVNHDLFRFGFGYRAIRYPFDFINNQQLLFYAGLNKSFGKYAYTQFMYSYDLSTTTLSTSVGSTHEITLIIYLSKGFKSKSTKMGSCEDYTKAGKLEVIGFPVDKARRFRKRKNNE